MTVEDEIESDLQKMLHEAALLYLQRKLGDSTDWAEVRAITEARTTRRDQLQADFERDFERRVGAARKRRLDEAAGRSLKHPAPPGLGSTGSNRIDRDARADVDLAHLADLVEADRAAERAILAMFDRVVAEEQAREQAHSASWVREAFARAGLQPIGDDPTGDGPISDGPTGPTQSQD